MRAPGDDDKSRDLEQLVARLSERGVRRVHVLAWRDLEDPDSGGSEVHADEFMRRWARAGLQITHRTSHAEGLPFEGTRHGYRVIRRGSRYSVFPRTMVSELLSRMGPRDGLVEIWNGVPWFSPLWARQPRLTFLHHVHGPMWDQIFPRPLSDLGRLLETRIAPPAYRRTEVLTPSESTRDELVDLGFRPERVTAVPNGVEPFFTPGGTRATVPTLVAVGRHAPVKRYAELIDQAEIARRSVPGLRLRILGDGPERPRLRQLASERGADWIELPGRVSREELVDDYRSAWLVVSASLAEGWGLSLTEGAACGTPTVATDIRGHRSSVVDGESGILVPLPQLGATIADVLRDDGRRARLEQGALRRASTLSWDDSAAAILAKLLEQGPGPSSGQR